jgi:hypothetical protein
MPSRADDKSRVFPRSRGAIHLLLCHRKLPGRPGRSDMATIDAMEERSKKHSEARAFDDTGRSSQVITIDSIETKH